MQWADGIEYTGNPKTDIRIMIVANQGGLREYVNQNRLNMAPTKAATELQYTLDRSRQIQFNVRKGHTARAVSPQAIP